MVEERWQNHGGFGFTGVGEGDEQWRWERRGQRVKPWFIFKMGVGWVLFGLKWWAGVCVGLYFGLVYNT